MRRRDERTDPAGAADPVAVVRAEQAYHRALNDFATAARAYAGLLVGRAVDTVDAIAVIRGHKGLASRS